MQLQPPQGPFQRTSEGLPLKQEAFKKEFDRLFAVWKSCWVSPGTGPMHVHEYTRDKLSPEQIEAEKPEEEARNALVEYSASVIQQAQGDERLEIIDCIVPIYWEKLNGFRDDAYALMVDIFKQTFSVQEKK